MTDLTPAEALTVETYDRQAETWSTEHMTPGFWSEEMAEFHSMLPKGRVLEVGSGGGRDAKELIKLGYDYVGTDISSGLIEQARKSNPNAMLLKKSVYDLDYEDEFDGFWCAAVLLHIPRERISDALEKITYSCRARAVGFIAVKEGDGEEVERDEFGSRLFVYWQNEAFQQIISEHGLSVETSGYKPMSARTKWLTYIVSVDK